MSDLRAYAKSQMVNRKTDDTWTELRATRDGAPIVQPWLTALTIEGKVYQVRMGTVTTPLVGDIVITTVAAEAAAEAALGYVIMPVYLNVQIEALGGTLPELAFNSVGALITTLGTAFTPLNLKIGGAAANARAAVAAAGGVAVAADGATTTRQIYRHTQAVAASVSCIANQVFEVPHVLVGPASVYLQIGSATTGSDYFGHFDFVELTAAEISS